MNYLRVVLHVLKENQLFAKYSKYEFLFRLVAFICHIISSERFEVDLRKTEAVKNWSKPLTPSNIRIFLGSRLLSEVSGWFCIHCISLDYFDSKE